MAAMSLSWAFLLSVDFRLPAEDILGYLEDQGFKLSRFRFLRRDLICGGGCSGLRSFIRRVYCCFLPRNRFDAIDSYNALQIEAPLAIHIGMVVKGDGDHLHLVPGIWRSPINLALHETKKRRQAKVVALACRLLVLF
jgi:hypothetical protein